MWRMCKKNKKQTLIVQHTTDEAKIYTITPNLVEYDMFSVIH